MRERFPADAPLSSVVEHITRRYPSLPSFSLLQGFPRKRFGQAELSCSLHSLGLTPNAALCIQTTPPETPQDAQNPPELPSAGQNEPSPCSVPPQLHVPVQEEAGDQDLLPPPLPNPLWEEAMNYAGIPEVGHSLSGPHFWGKYIHQSLFDVYSSIRSPVNTRVRRVLVLEIPIFYTDYSGLTPIKDIKDDARTVTHSLNTFYGNKD